jgi:hypothetical protein
MTKRRKIEKPSTRQIRVHPGRLEEESELSELSEELGWSELTLRTVEGSGGEWRR